ncbi:MAG: hypothetical protein RL754_560 [Bacteroidota bacterium]|jgi:hypothetical protein
MMKLLKTKEDLLRITTIFGAFALIASCSITSTKIEDGAFFVNSMDDKTPLAGLYLELMFTNDEGSSYKVIASTTTDSDGYFEFDEKYSGCFDCFSHVNVYSDPEYSDTLGTFSYANQRDNIWGAKVIHTDTFSLEHNVWAVPRIGDLGGLNADRIEFRYHTWSGINNVSPQSYTTPLSAGTTFQPSQMTMSLGDQHWFRFGSGDVARGTIFQGLNEVGWGYFKLLDYRGSNEGDSLFIDFSIEE